MARLTDPPLKWPGGKRRLLPKILPLVPKFTGVYREPFVGGGAVFFALQPEHAVLSDSNLILIRALRGIRDNVEPVIQMLHCYLNGEKLSNAEEFYYGVRQEKHTSDATVAAWLIYMNQTCFNGLYRVNKRGQFNTPWGKREFSFDAEKLREASRALKYRPIHCRDFEEVLDDSCRDDFVYCDPPYDGTYTGYTEGGFSELHQERLSNCVRRARKRGVQVMVSNSDTPLIRSLYSGFTFIEISGPRSIAANGKRRQKAAELIIQ